MSTQSELIALLESLYRLGDEKKEVDRVIRRIEAELRLRTDNKIDRHLREKAKKKTMRV